MTLVKFWPVGGPQPLTLSLQANSPTEAALSWADRSGGRARYEIRRDDVLINTTAAGATSYTDTAATAGATHEYEVRAIAPYWNAIVGRANQITMPTTQTGLLWPDSNVSPFTNKMIVLFNEGEGSAEPFPLYPAAGATYIWRAMPMQKLDVSTYWSSLFRTQWSPSWEAEGSGAVNFEYYCCHPYPDLAQSRAEWEISMNAEDEHTEPVEYDRWHIQVVDVSPSKQVTFYFDWPNTGAGFQVGPITQDSRSAQTNPAYFLGDTLWQSERYRGVLRGFQTYDARLASGGALSAAQVNAELASPGSVRTPWYFNMNPTPDDISDKSGNGNHPKWYSAAKASLWEA